MSDDMVVPADVPETTPAREEYLLDNEDNTKEDEIERPSTVLDPKNDLVDANKPALIVDDDIAEDEQTSEAFQKEITSLPKRDSFDPDQISAVFENKEAEEEGEEAEGEIEPIEKKGEIEPIEEEGEVEREAIEEEGEGGGELIEEGEGGGEPIEEEGEGGGEPIKEESEGETIEKEVSEHADEIIIEYNPDIASRVLEGDLDEQFVLEDNEVVSEEKERVVVEDKVQKKVKKGKISTENKEVEVASRDHVSDKEKKETIMKGKTRQIDELKLAKKHDLSRKASVASKLTHREPVEYDFGPKVIFDDSTHHEDLDDDFNYHLSDVYTSILLETKEEEREEEEYVQSEVIEEIISVFDRSVYYDKHAELKELKKDILIRNRILEKFIVAYYRRKKMELAVQVEDHAFDELQKYRKYLDEYATALEEFKMRRNHIEQKIDFLKKTKEKKTYALKMAFQAFQNREKEIGTGLINSKTGTEIPERLVLQLINRQRIDLEKMCSMRLKFIKLKTMVEEKEQMTMVLDEVDEEHHLDYYEKLKSENKLCSDKVEEKEVELTKLRLKCKDNIQVLSHLREKISALDNDIADVRELTSSRNELVSRMRKSMNTIKKERDKYRSLLIKMYHDSGLLKERVLLKDMKHSNYELGELKKQLIKLKEDCRYKIEAIRCIRRKIEKLTVMGGPRKIFMDQRCLLKVHSNQSKQKLVNSNGAPNNLRQNFKAVITGTSINLR